MSFNPTCQTYNISIGPLWALAIVVWHRNLFNICSTLSATTKRAGIHRRAPCHWAGGILNGVVGWESIFLFFLLSWEHRPVSAVVHLSKQT